MRPPLLPLVALFLAAAASLAAQAKFTQPPAVTPNPNPRAPLAAVLTFATDVPTATQVRIADDAGRTWELTFDEASAPQRGLALVGFRPGRRHEIRVVLRDRAGRETAAPATLLFQAPPLPAAADAFPPLTVTRDSSAPVEPGYTLLSVRRQGPGRPTDPFNTGWGMIVAIDAEGVPVWYYEASARISDFERGPNGNLFLCTLEYEILEIDLLGNEVARWHAAGRPKGAGPGISVPTMTFHHEIDLLPGGNLVVLGTDRRALPNYYTSETDARAPRQTQQVMGDEVIEFSREGRVVRKWNAFDHLDPYRIGYETFSGYWERRGFPGTLDWSHANNLVYDPSDDSLLVSFRYLAAIVKIDRVSGQVKWILGKPDGWAEKYRPLLFRAEGDLQWFQHQHSPFPTSRGTLIVFDNGNYGTMPFTPPKPRAETFSRAVEYQLDPERRTVRQVWASAQGPGPDTVLSEAMGNAEQMPGTGNVLVFYGALNRAGGASWSRGREYTHTTPARVLWEVVARDPQGKTGWQFFCGTRWANLQRP